MPVEAWLMDDSEGDMRLPHHRNPPEFVGEDFMAKHGILFWKIDSDGENYEQNETYKQIKTERGYTYEDEVTIAKDKLPNYEEKLKMFYREHLHVDEEIRFCVEGSGYFDFRDFQERWVRIKFTKGDLFVLPAGIYHRFTLDEQNFIKAKRLFVGEPVWTPYNRPADDKPARTAYLQTIQGLTLD